MLVCLIILVILLLILACPVGIDACVCADERFLKLKIGPFRKTVLPREKKEKTAPPEEKPETQEEDAPKKKKKRKLTLDDILTLAEIALDALHRFRIHLCVDRFDLLWIAANSDPYDAVQQYGRVNALLGPLMAKAHNALKIRDEDVRCELDLTAPRPTVELRCILSIQIWEILLIGLCAGIKFLRWNSKNKRNERAAAADASERSIPNGEL